MIYEMAQRRDLIRVGEDLVAHAFDPPLDHGTADIIEKAEGALYQVAETSRYGGGFKSFKESLTGAVTAAERAFQSSSHVSGVGTGFDDLDHMLGGFQASDLIIVAGRPGMGKTAFATNIAFHAARNHFLSGQKSGAAVAFFSLEMSAEQLAGRILAAEAEIQGNKIRRGKIESRDFEKLAQVAMDLESIPLSIDDTGGLTIAQVAARCRKLKRTRGLGMVMVDYLQLLSGSLNKRNENRVQEVTEITKGLKNLAKELSVPVVALSQLSRSVDSRDDKRPVLADLRESGSIEQDADVVLFVFREEYYLATKEPDPDDPGYAKWQEKMSRIHGKAEVLVEKHRHGPTGPVHLGFEKQFTRFFNLAKEEFLPDRRR
jgi:replicative DNA helicase